MGADLSGADLSQANLYQAELSGADLYKADFTAANLSGGIVPVVKRANHAIGLEASSCQGVTLEASKRVSKNGQKNGSIGNDFEQWGGYLSLPHRMPL